MLLLGAIATAAAAGAFLDAPMASGVTGPPPNTTVWTDTLTLGVRGRGWDAAKMASPFARLPTHAHQTLCSNQSCAAQCSEAECEAKRCAVWGLSQTATGLNVQFATSASQVHVRFTLDPENGDWLWAFNGHSGIDVYVQDSATGGSWRWATSSGNNPANDGILLHISGVLQ